jgi:S1-C subfamily serine protease
MSDIKRSNGHKLEGILPVAEPLIPGPRPGPDDAGFDLEAALGAVWALESRVPADAISARNLGMEREGNAVLIDDSGILVTIGYLITEATDVEVRNGDRKVAAQVIGYDHGTGFGLIQTVEKLDARPLEISKDVSGFGEDMPVIIASSGGVKASILGTVAERRNFAGSWEYMLDSAIFTVPLHPRWSGSALIDPVTGKLIGIGSLFVQQAGGDDDGAPGNMFVPADLLPPIYDELITTGRARSRARPWLGMHTTEAMGSLVVSGVHDEGPADSAGVRPGDIIEKIEDEEITELSEMYSRIWAVGGAGADISLSLIRGSRGLDIIVRSADRHDFLKLPRRH